MNLQTDNKEVAKIFAATVLTARLAGDARVLGEDFKTIYKAISEAVAEHEAAQAGESLRAN